MAFCFLLFSMTTLLQLGVYEALVLLVKDHSYLNEYMYNSIQFLSKESVLHEVASY